MLLILILCYKILSIYSLCCGHSSCHIVLHIPICTRDTCTDGYFLVASPFFLLVSRKIGLSCLHGMWRGQNYYRLLYRDLGWFLYLSGILKVYMSWGGCLFLFLLVAPNYKMRRSVVDLDGSGRARDATGSSRFSRLPAHENLDRQSSHNTRTVKMWIPRLETFFFVVIYHFPYVEDSCLKGLFII